MTGKENSYNLNSADKTGSTDEATPLLAPTTTNGKQLWSKLRAATYLSFTRRRHANAVLSSNERKSLRLPLNDLFQEHGILEPADGLAPLASGGTIVCTNGYRTTTRPASSVKSLPAFAPFRRTDRHRNFYLWWLNEFRHWWKSSRLLVRLAGLWTLAITVDFLAKMHSVDPYKDPRKHKHRANVKNSEKAVRVVKKLGRGGEMRWFLQTVQVFTRCLRIVIGTWRWVEAAQCRRLEVGVEEAMVRFLKTNAANQVVRASFLTFTLAPVSRPLREIVRHVSLPEPLWTC